MITGILAAVEGIGTVEAVTELNHSEHLPRRLVRIEVAALAAAALAFVALVALALSALH